MRHKEPSEGQGGKPRGTAARVRQEREGKEPRDTGARW